MDTTQTDDPKLPPDNGKEWMETNLPNTDEEGLFMGFSENEQTSTQNKNQQRKRREKDTYQDKHTKQLKKLQPHTQLPTRSQTQTITSTNENLNSQTTRNTMTLTSQTTKKHDERKTNKQPNQLDPKQSTQHTFYRTNLNQGRGKIARTNGSGQISP